MNLKRELKGVCAGALKFNEQILKMNLKRELKDPKGAERHPSHYYVDESQKRIERKAGDRLNFVSKPL